MENTYDNRTSVKPTSRLTGLDVLRGVELFRGRLDITIVNCRNLPRMDWFGGCDAYVSVSLNNSKLGRTQKVSHTRNPDFNVTFVKYVCHHAKCLLFKVKDQDKFSAEDYIGSVEIPLEKLLPGKLVQGDFPILGQEKKGSTIYLRVQLFPPDKEVDQMEVPRVYFPVRHDNFVKLFHDAHVIDTHTIKCCPGYEEVSLWNTIYDTLNKSKRYIYIAGWAVFPDLKLKRNEEEDREVSETLGELLVRRANEGVNVVVMVWDEGLSTTNSVTGNWNNGVLGTFDEYVYKYFKATKVHACKVPRSGSDKSKGWFNRMISRNMMQYWYTHHQKEVVCDDGEGTEIAFIGGIDLTDGRYDTGRHRIFEGLNNTWPVNDYHNPNVADGSVNPNTGPREPWHDIHGQLIGPVTKDAKQNFVERYVQQGLKRRTRLIRSKVDNFIAKLMDGALPCGSTEDKGSIPPNAGDWSVQIFRSLDEEAAKYLSSTENLNYSMGHVIDEGIHRAYIHNIRRAKNFIYIENQYFLGSSHWWNSSLELSDHLIPIEITMKIIEKIKQKEEFHCYIVVPMWPEGVPSDKAIQEILNFQFETVQMMYELIGECLEEEGLYDVHPTKYLSMYCLGRREQVHYPANQSLKPCSPNTTGALLQKYKRFMIYVHSKMMIVDDEYIIVGSANINKRSMAGMRDSELCFGAYQKDYLAKLGVNPKGGVHQFRMACMAEHLGSKICQPESVQCEEQYQRLLENPHSKDCSEFIRNTALDNWKSYISEEDVDVHSHLLAYPYNIKRNGSINFDAKKEDEACFQFFPDTKALIKGATSWVIPDYITT